MQAPHRLTDKELQVTGPVSIDLHVFDEMRESLFEIIAKAIQRLKKSNSRTGVARLLMD